MSGDELTDISMLSAEDIKNLLDECRRSSERIGALKDEISDYQCANADLSARIAELEAKLAASEMVQVAVVEDWPNDNTPIGLVPLVSLKTLPIGTKLYAPIAQAAK